MFYLTSELSVRDAVAQLVRDGNGDPLVAVLNEVAVAVRKNYDPKGVSGPAGMANSARVFTTRIDDDLSDNAAILLAALLKKHGKDQK